MIYISVSEQWDPVGVSWNSETRTIYAESHVRDNMIWEKTSNYLLQFQLASSGIIVWNIDSTIGCRYLLKH